jgi:hypothetical protein
MASSSSDSSNSSTESKTSWEMTLEFDSKAACEACAPLHWDVEEWDFWAWSVDDESLTDGEDLQFLLDGELEDEDEDDMSWEGHDSSSKEDDDDELTEEDPMAGSFLHAMTSDEDNGRDSDDRADGDDDSTSDDGARDDDSDGGSGDDDGDFGVVPPIKHRRFSGTY